MSDKLNTPVRYLKGIGPKRAAVLNNLGINTVEDLVYYLPRCYEDRRNITPISKIKEGSFVTVRAEVLAKGGHDSFWRHNFGLIEIAVGDPTGRIGCVWFNQPYIKEYLKVGNQLILYGKAQKYKDKLQINSPEFELLDTQNDISPDESLNIGRIVPVYPLPEKITQRSLRKIIKSALDTLLPQIKDSLPFDIRSRHNFLNLAKALLNIHFPQDDETRKQAYRRLSFEEFLLFQIPIILRKLKKKEQAGIAHRTEGRLAADFRQGLPFTLTHGQEQALNEIRLDMATPQVMQRLLQGDVGCGKTVVATIACLFAIQGGYQAAFMVPTEILAKQHYEKISSQVSVLGSERKPKIALLVGSIPDRERQRIQRKIKDGEVDLVIGTHALLEEEIKFKSLGLVVIDEQHKFGVAQRSLLPQKGRRPDVLIMTATPIPRTLGITIYGDLDISVIKELPSMRAAIKTLYFTQDERSRAYQIARDEVEKSGQVYIVYPVIDESCALDIAGAKEMYEELKQGEFKAFRLGLIHGRLKQKEQDEVMLKFRNQELDILISTTVLEVGIDVANATCMIIEHAERFGLSQLHQLRGRVGRGRSDSICILISDSESPEAKARLRAMLNYADGFRIAEEDLKIRGPGEFFGSRQHGLSELKIGNPLTQMQLLKLAREEARKLLKADPHLESRQNGLLKERLIERFPEYEKFIGVA